MTLDDIEVKPNKIKTLREYELLQKLKKISYDLSVCKFTGGECIEGIAWCCDQCANKAGYLKYMITGDIDNYSSFDSTSGFYNSESGCQLPLEHRSVTCITFLCDSAKSGIIDDHGQDYLDGLTAIKEIMDEEEGIIQATQVSE